MEKEFIPRGNCLGKGN